MVGYQILNVIVELVAALISVVLHKLLISVSASQVAASKELTWSVKVKAATSPAWEVV